MLLEKLVASFVPRTCHLSVEPRQVAGRDLGAYHQGGARRAGAHGVDGLLQAEGGRRAGDVHVEGVAASADGILNLDAQRRIRALHVRRGADQHVDLARVTAGGGESVARGSRADFRLQRQRIVRARRQVRAHARRVEHAGLVDHVALPDPRSLLDEFRRRFGQRGELAGSDGFGVLFVVALGVGVERDHQFFVGDDFRCNPQAGAADDDVVHTHCS
jgi:hypothetical protein